MKKRQKTQLPMNRWFFKHLPLFQKNDCWQKHHHRFEGRSETWSQRSRRPSFLSLSLSLVALFYFELKPNFCSVCVFYPPVSSWVPFNPRKQLLRVLYFSIWPREPRICVDFARREPRTGLASFLSQYSTWATDPRLRAEAGKIRRSSGFPAAGSRVIRCEGSGQRVSNRSGRRPGRSRRRSRFLWLKARKYFDLRIVCIVDRPIILLVSKILCGRVDIWCPVDISAIKKQVLLSIYFNYTPALD